jgi:sugar lactone lactonase YvrE
MLLAGALGWISMAESAAAQSLAATYVPVITNFAGQPGVTGYAGDGGAATSATLNAPWGIAYDANGNLYIADNQNNVIRRVDAATGNMTTVAGNGTGGFGGDAGPATQALLNGPEQVAFDPAGNMYIADTGNSRIRMVNAQTQIITTVVGNGVSGAFTVGVTGPNTPLKTPRSVQVDRAGNIFVANAGLNDVLEIPAATGLTVAYAGVGGGSKSKTGGDGGQAILATFAGPYNMSVDPAGNLYLCDHTNNVIRKITASTGIITTVAGTNAATGDTGDGGPATSATLNAPVGVFADQSGNFYIANTGGNTVRFVNGQTGIISKFAGTGTVGTAGNGGAAVAAQLNGDSAVAVSPNGKLVAISNQNSNAISVAFVANDFPSVAVGASSTAQTVIAQAGTSGTASAFQLDPGIPADFVAGTPSGCPGAMAAAALCSLPVTFSPTAPGVRTSRVALTDSTGNNYFLGVNGVGTSPAVSFLPGIIATVAGSGTAGSTGDGSAATSARVNLPGNMALDASGNLYIADTANNKIRLVSKTTGAISTYAGTGVAGFAGDGAAAANAQLNAPASVSLDAAGNLYIADTGNHRIRMVSAQTGTISTVVGTGTAGSSGDGGLAGSAAVSSPAGVVSDSDGDLYIADTGNHKIRFVNAATGLISTFAGTGTAGSTGNNVAATTATLNGPRGIGLDAAGNLYIADTGSNLVREVHAGIITTVAGSGTAGNSGDGGLATAAALNSPTAVALDAAGDVYVADSANNVVRRISAADGTIAAVAGTGTAGLSGDNGSPLSAMLQGPAGVAVDATGSFYIADTANSRIAYVNVAQGALDFGKINVGSSSDPQTLYLENIGNQPLVMSALASSSASYQQVAGSGSPADCSATTTLAPGAECQLSLRYTASIQGGENASFTVTDNALNVSSATQVIALSGTGVKVAGPSSITAAGGSQQAVAPLGVFPIALQALVTDNSSNPVAGVTVTFTAPTSGASVTFANASNIVTAVTGSNGIASVSNATASATRGTFSINATVSGVATPAVFTEAIAGNIAPTLSLANAGSASVSYGQTVTLNAALSPSSLGGTQATGTVTFYDNATAVGTAPISSGSASTSYTPVAGTHALTASYSGDGNFSASTTTSSLSLTVSQLPITGTASSVSVPYGTPPNPIAGTLNGVLAADTANVSVSFAPAGAAQAPNVGQYALAGTLSGSAAANYTLTVTGNPTYTVTPAATTMSLSVSSTQPSLGSSVTLKATVVSVVSGAPSPVGSVTFFSGTTSLGSAALNAGVATLVTTALPAGSQSITATYVGNANTTASTSSGIAVSVVAPDFTVAANPAAATVKQGATAYATFTVTGNQAFTGTVAFSCTALPANTACTFTPSTVTGSGSTLLEINTAGSSTAAVRSPWDRSMISLAIMFPGLLLFGLARRGKRSGIRRMVMTGIVLLGGLGVALGCSGCGSSSHASATVATPTGTYSVSISTQAGSVSHAVPFTLTVVSAN